MKMYDPYPSKKRLVFIGIVAFLLGTVMYWVVAWEQLGL
jgi:hypothetical protein